MTEHYRSPRSVRSMFSLAIVVVAFLAIVSVGALITTTTALERTTSEVAAAVESVRLAEEAEISLLLHARGRDAVLKRNIEGELRELLTNAERYVTSRGERDVLGHAVASVETYLLVANDRNAVPDALAQVETIAFAALEQLVAINVENTREAHEESIAWNRTASVAGVLAGVAIVAITLALILWLRRRFVRPWFALTDTVRQFGEGDRAARAAERGPPELREMSRRFNEMADAIAMQRQAQVAFLGGVAHDLRTPLSAVRLATDMLRPTEPLPPEPHMRRTIDIISRQINQLERMLGDFMDMSQIEAGKLDLHVAYHDVRSIVREAVRLFATADATREFHVSLPHEPGLALCDDVRIGQAVTNLVSNAIKYSPRHQPIEVDVKLDGKDVVIAVTDHGAGIAREDHRRIFEPFHRVGGRDGTSGTGLGLFNVQRIVERHGGRIEVESAPGRGSTFRMFLRLAHTGVALDDPYDNSVQRGRS